MIDNNTLNDIGAKGAQTVLYLPNPPKIYHGFEPHKPDVTKLVEENGNHWRKIFTILAKLTCGEQPWKTYRDENLLQAQQKICFTDTLCADARWHLVAGKASWSRLGFFCEDFSCEDQQERLYIKDNILLVPYLDYRQYPNDLIAKTVELMHKT